MVTKASQATVINNRTVTDTVTKSLMVTDTEIRIPMDIKTTDMVNNLTGPDMDKTRMVPDMDKTRMDLVMDKTPTDLGMDKLLMDPDMDTNNLMVMVTDTVTNPTVMDIVN